MWRGGVCVERSCTVECRAEVCVRCECKEKLCFVHKYKHHMHHSEHRTHVFVGDVCVLSQVFLRVSLFGSATKRRDAPPKEEKHHQCERGKNTCAA